jgi:Ca2+-binding EF-hand superfamily protein
MTRALGKIPLAALGIALASLIFPARGSQILDPPPPPASPKAFFAPGRLHTIHIRLSAEGWKLLQPGAGSQWLHANKTPAAATQTVALRTGAEGYAYVKTDVDFDGQEIKSAGMRFKGGMSYSVSTAFPRRPMKLDFERFVPGGRFAGVTTLNLNNQALDPSQAREALAFELFRELGVPAPRTGYALVYLTVPGTYDREFLGLYTLLEEVDGKFLKRHFGNEQGLLVKPEGMRGLAYLGEDWNRYAGIYRPKTSVDPKLARRMMELAKLVHRADDAAFRNNVATYLDVDELLRYVAVNAALANFDSFLSTGHNYYVYMNPADGRAVFIPWDMNMAFAGYTWVGTQEEIERLSITHPYVDHNLLIERLLQIEAHRNAYAGHVRRLVEGGFSIESIRRKVAAIAPLIQRAGEVAAQAGKAGSPATRPTTVPRLHVPELLTYVAHRGESMRLQLDGKQGGFIPAFRDPDLVLEEWAKIVKPAGALLAALDTNHDGRVDDQELNKAVEALVGSQGSLDVASATKALDKLLTDDMRRCATAENWAKWLFRVADANHDGRLDAKEIQTAYHTLLSGADKDFDGMMGGREMIEALSGIGPP